MTSTIQGRHSVPRRAVAAALFLGCAVSLPGCERGPTGDPPTIQIVITGGHAHKSHRGETYYLVRDKIGFDAVAMDPEDGILSSTLLLDDEPYEAGTPIIEPGRHTLHASTADADGNRNTHFRAIEVQRNEEAESHIKLVSLEPYLDKNGKNLLKATISIELPVFNVNDINVSMIRLMGKAPGASDFRKAVDGAWNDEGLIETPDNANARIESNILTCVISGLPASTDPNTLQVIGGGKGYPDSFAFWENVQMAESDLKE